MSDEKENIETRTVTLNAFKTRYAPQTEEAEQGGGSCAPWYIELRGGHYYTCRWCATSGPTAIPYKECIQLPD